MKSLVKITSAIVVLAACWFSISNLEDTQDVATGIHFTGSEAKYTPAKTPVYNDASSSNLFSHNIGSIANSNIGSNIGDGSMLPVFSGRNDNGASHVNTTGIVDLNSPLSYSRSSRNNMSNESAVISGGIVLAHNRLTGTALADSGNGQLRKEGGNINMLDPSNPPPEPFEPPAPVPDGLWMVMLLAIGYVIIIRRKGL